MQTAQKISPNKELMKLYFSYLLFAEAGGVLTVVLPVVAAALIFMPSEEALIVSGFVVSPFLFSVAFVAFWIPRYYTSISYALSEAEISVERGVWWKQENTVPYNRITNIDVVQGPLSRRFGLAKVRVQTAGYSATGGGAVAEVTITGIKNYEEIRDFILSRTRILKPVAVEVHTEIGEDKAKPEAITQGDVSQRMLAELKMIREILERQPSQATSKSKNA